MDSTPTTGLWYTLWWRTDAGGHWDEWLRYVPLIGKYTSGSATTFPRELADLEAMRADYLLPDHTNGFGADGGALSTAGHQKDENSAEVYQVGPDGLVYQGAMPVCHPAVNVPAGYLDGFAKAAP